MGLAVDTTSVSTCPYPVKVISCILHIGAANLYGGVDTLLFMLARCRDLCPDRSSLSISMADSKES